MTLETKERAIFVVASLINLADMAESNLREVVELVGIDSMRELMEKGSLRYEITYEEMAEEICTVIDWEPTLVAPCRTDRDLSRLGLQVAETINSTSPADEDVAERLFSFLSWEGFGAWLSLNDGSGGPM